jgi:hypothetical protein
MMDELKVAFDGDELVISVLVDGKWLKIAKRGGPGTRHAMTWISLEPGWDVVSPPGHEWIEVSHNGVRVH